MTALRIATAPPLAPDQLGAFDRQLAPHVRECVDREVREQVDAALRRQLAELLAPSLARVHALPRAA